MDDLFKEPDILRAGNINAGRKNWKKYLIIPLFIAYLFGIITFYTNHFEFVYIFSSILFILILSVHFFKIKNVSPKFLLIIFLLFAFGFLNSKINSTAADEFSGIENVKNAKLTGEIISIPKYIQKSNAYKFYLKVKTAGINGKMYEIKKAKVLIVLKNTNKKEINFADNISIKGTLTLPNSPSNPLKFDYRQFLKNKGVLKILYSENEIEKIPPKSAPNNHKPYAFFRTLKDKNLTTEITKNLYKIRDNILLKHSKYIKSPNLEVLGGVVFGDEAVNSPDIVKDSFINSGLLHLLAASGLNVAFILSMWLCLIHFFKFKEKTRILSGIFVVFLYTVMTGFPPSIVRASVMLLLILSGKLLSKKEENVSLIFLAGFLILIFKPDYAIDVGFQLSFLVTLGLIVCIPKVTCILSKQEENYIEKIKTKPKIVKSFLLIFSPVSIICCIFVPITAQLWAAPLQAYYFNTFSLYSVFANIAVLPFIGIVSCLGFLSCAFCLVPFFDIFLPFIDCILNGVITVVLFISNFFAGLQYSLLKVPPPSVFMILVFYIFVILIFNCIRHLFKNRLLNIFTAAAFLLLFVLNIHFEIPKTEVIFFDTGNADNFLIKTPKNKYIMIDTGKQIYKDLTTAKTVTLEYLYNKNVREIDTLILTHFDSDHSGGLVDILENVKVKRLIMPKPVCTSINSCAIKEYISKNNIKYIEPFSGQKLDFDGDIHLVNYVPFENHINRQKSKNMYSTVTLLIAGGRKFLFMADAPLKSYRDIKGKIPNNIDVLKVAHHGASGTTDDEMMYKLRPKFSIISTGKNNYGHPDKDTVKLISKYSIPLSAMDYGAIKFEIMSPNFCHEFLKRVFKGQETADKKPDDNAATRIDTACSNAGAAMKDSTGNNTGGFSKGNNAEDICKNVTGNSTGGSYKGIVSDIAAKNSTDGIYKDVTDTYLNNDTKLNLSVKHYQKQIKHFTPIRVFKRGL